MHYLEQADTISYEIFLKGLTTDTIRKISADLHEPNRMLEHRLHCLEIFRESKNPTF
ncbi:MAG: hypothetical protein LBG52_08545 [Candidatus Peribacteria bacterium]|nr:hypothetical protein [Candidatus Peribacteria bacterium]